MISLITLLSITENIQQFNPNYDGYYLGHDDNKVAFGYNTPMKPNSFNETPLFYVNNLNATEFYYNEVIEFIDCNAKNSNRLFNIPSLDDAEFIATKTAKYNIDSSLSSWIMHKSNRGILAKYNFKKRSVFAASHNPFHQILTAPILMIRYVDILK